jgi:ADP-ribosylglycohydrolase
LRLGVPAARAGQTGQETNGNGSLMRVLPLALWHTGSDGQLVSDAQAQSLVTHGHLRSQVCCALCCLWARRILQDAPDPWAEATATLRFLYRENPAAQEELEWSIRPDDEPSGTGSGYVVDCLRSARLALQEPTYEEVIRAAIRLGNDTDTTACVAGGLAGLRDGYQSIPARWRNALRGQELAEPLTQALLALRSTS